MTIGFIDVASINSALGAVSAGRKGISPDWDKQCLIKATFLLMHNNIHVLPTVGDRSEATEYYQQVVSTFPELESYNVKNKREAQQKTKTWLTKNTSNVLKAWNQSQDDPLFREWADVHKEQAFVRHVKRHGSLFDSMFIPHICRILDCSENDLQRVYVLSSDTNLVGKWAKNEGLAEEIELAKKAWLLAGIMRAKYHEYFARAENLQLSSHPFREIIGGEQKPGPLHQVYKSEELFVKMIIGSSLLETSASRRVTVWVQSTRKARDAILRKGIALPDAMNESDAERYAADAAKVIGLQSSPAVLRRAIDIAFSIGLGILLGIKIAPWASPLSPIIQQTYRHLRDASIGDDMTKIALSTRRRFLKLAKSVPGRIEYNLLRGDSK